MDQSKSKNKKTKPDIPKINGRPTKYDPKFLDVVNKYILEAVPENMDIPTMEGLALKLDVEIKTLYNWSKKNPDFLHAIRRLKKEQKQHLIKTGIFGGKEINPTIIALMLRVNHKMVEVTKSTNKTDLTSGGKKLNPILVKFIKDENDR